MPATINGVGTSVCDAGGHVKWGGPADCDAVECFVILFLPLIPFKAVHTFQWNGMNYRQVPITWSLPLVIRAFARRWLLGLALAALILILCGFSTRDSLVAAALFVSALALVVIMGLGYWVLWITDQRSRDLRRVLGPHALGSSDPATWRPELLQAMAGPRNLFGTDSYGAAVPILLEDRRYGSAMMAARLTVALEDRAFGEQLTDIILHDPDVEAALQVVRRTPQQWASVMEATGQASSPPPPEWKPAATDPTTDITRNPSDA